MTNTLLQINTLSSPLPSVRDAEWYAEKWTHGGLVLGGGGVPSSPGLLSIIKEFLIFLCWQNFGSAKIACCAMLQRGDSHFTKILSWWKKTVFPPWTAGWALDISRSKIVWAFIMQIITFRKENYALDSATNCFYFEI